MQNNQKAVVELDIDDVLPNRFQPRIKFDENSINELALSIKKYGVIQPIVVRKISDKYEIIAGERRYKASVIAGKKTIPAIICEMTDKDSVEIALIENVQREDLTPIEKAISYKKILDMGYVNQEDLAQKVGKSQSSIANTLRLLNLSDEVQEALLENKISERHARSLLKIKDNYKQVQMLNKIINERLTVRKTDEEIDKMLNDDVNKELENQVNLESEQVVKIPDLIDPPSFNSNGTMPGFMDIDRIEVEAKDIIPEEKPKADIDDLLKKDTLFKEVKSEDNKEEEAMLNSGKFFRFFDSTNDESSDNQSSFVNNDSFFNSFNPSQTDNFNISDIPTGPVASEVSTFPIMPDIPSYEPQMEIPSSPATPEVSTTPIMPDIPSYDPQMNIPSSPAVPEVSTTPIMPDIPNYEPQMNIPSSPAIPEVSTTPIMPDIPNYEPQMNIPSSPAIPEVSTTPIMPDIPNYEPQMNIPSSPVTPEVSTTPIMPDIPNYEPQMETNSDISITDEDLLSDTQKIPVITNDQIQEEQKLGGNTIIATAPNLKLALNTVRECQNTLEKYGFIVDVEEIDFEDSYQVIFKIEK